MTTHPFHAAGRVWLLALLSAVSPRPWAEAATDLPADLWAAVTEAQHRIEASGDSHYAWNPGNRLQLRFEADALEVRPGAHDQTWQWGLKLTGYGTPGRIEPVGAAGAEIRGNRLEYRRGPVTEWYENRPEGLEQGFTLAAPPRPGADAVVLRMAIQGGLRPQLDASARSAVFRGADGTPALRYTELKVVDANGAALPAKLAVADDALHIEVRTEGAVWPIVVDPLIQSTQRLTGEANDDQYGYSVAISGNTAAVGAPDHRQTDLIGPCGLLGTCYGKVYLFNRALTADTGDATWTESTSYMLNTSLLGALGILRILDYDARFGASVALQGDTLQIGAPEAGQDEILIIGLVRNYQGRVFIVNRSGGTWPSGASASLTAPNAANGDRFGTALALSDNSDHSDYVAVIGAPNAANGGSSRGKGYVFTGSGSNWTQRVAAGGSANNDRFGAGVAASGNIALIGAPGQATNGVVSRYLRTGATTWSGATTIAAPSGASAFGSAVSLFGDSALIGAPGTSGAGAAYVYSDVGGTPTSDTTLTATPGSGVTVSQFGSAVALYQDTALVGAYNSTVSSNSASGAAYLFSGSRATWSQQAELTSTTPAASNNFGQAVALSGYNAIVGAPGESSGADSNVGAIYSLIYPCGFGVSIPADPAVQTDKWGMLASPCHVTSGVGTAFASVPNYGTRWVIRSYSEATNTTTNLSGTDTLTQGRSYWYRGKDAGVLQVESGTANATAVTKDADCDTSINPDGCYAVPLILPSDGNDLMNFIGSNMPFNVDWSAVRVKVVGGSKAGVYSSPDVAATAGVIVNTIYVWNGSQAKYDSYNTSPGSEGMLRVFQGFWLEVKAGTGADSISLLIPAKPSLKTSQTSPVDGHPASAEMPWYLGWLDWLVPATEAAPSDDSDFSSAPMPPKPFFPGRHRQPEQRPAQAVRDQPEPSTAAAKAVGNKGWYVRLIVEIPDQRIKDDNNILGQLTGAKVGYDGHDAPELPPFGEPYLTIVFPHPGWGDAKGDYTVDYRPLKNSKSPIEKSKTAGRWDFEIRSSQSNVDVRLRWEATDVEILKYSRLTDRDSGKGLPVMKMTDGLTVTMPIEKVARYTWRYLGR